MADPKPVGRAIRGADSRCVCAGLLVRSIAAVIVVGAIISLPVSPVQAHVTLQSSTPADGAILTEPVSEIALVFTSAAIPAGDGFLVLGADAVPRPPDQVSTTDNLTWTLRFAEPFQSGNIRVRWTVEDKADGHLEAGQFSFRIGEEKQPVSTVPAGVGISEMGDAEPSGLSLPTVLLAFVVMIAAGSFYVFRPTRARQTSS